MLGIPLPIILLLWVFHVIWRAIRNHQRHCAVEPGQRV